MAGTAEPTAFYPASMSGIVSHTSHWGVGKLHSWERTMHVVYVWLKCIILFKEVKVFKCWLISTTCPQLRKGVEIHNHKFIGAMLLSPKLDKVLGQRIWFLEALEKELHERLSGDIIKIVVLAEVNVSLFWIKKYLFL